MRNLAGLTGSAGFLGAGAWEDARGVILGAPLDITASYRPGTRFGPERIRAVSSVLETYSLALDRDLGGVAYCDAGDLEMLPGNLQASLEAIRQGVAAVLEAGKTPFLLGGEHLVTVPAIEAYVKRFPDLALLHFDAHADLRSNYMGLAYSHASVLSQVKEVGVKDIYSFGVRSAAAEELTRKHDLSGFYPFSVLQPLQKVAKNLQERPVYITLDIDVVDPAFAPGTGTPEPGGVTASEILAVTAIFKELTVVGFDLVEVCPPYDANGITAVLAAKLLREVLLAVLGEDD